MTGEHARHHICIDFEGEGLKKGGLPTPHLLGALVPDGSGGSEYYLYLLRAELAPLERVQTLTGKVENRRVCTLLQAIQDLNQRADELRCYLVGYSQHESEVVRHHLQAHRHEQAAFQHRWYNIKKNAQKLLRKKQEKPEDGWTLDEVMNGLKPGHKSPPPPHCGAAEACRRITNAGAKSSRWKAWSPAHKALARDLILYNRGDCKAVWRLVNVVAAKYSLGEPN